MTELEKLQKFCKFMADDWDIECRELDMYDYQVRLNDDGMCFYLEASKTEEEAAKKILDRFRHALKEVDNDH